MTLSKNSKNATRVAKLSLGAALLTFGSLTLQAQNTPETPTPPSPETIEQAVDTVVEREGDAIQTQSKIEALSDQTDTLESEYKAVIRELEVVNRYNDQMKQIIDSQKSEIAIIESDLAKLQDTQREIVPLLLRMIEALDQFVEADTPFLINERQGRVAELKELMNRGDISIAEKYRKVFDAYQQENNLARNIEATTGNVNYKGEDRTVNFLRVGRVAFFFKSLDGNLIARWDTKTSDWTVVEDDSEKLSILTAFKIARKEIPVDLLVLPVTQP
ncbi:hypothetical protein VDG1235_2196 [Verrucomicrobiia bacterium DG1235]|nr:hypothetical protein VDG1235_2196 [Verrucomicrobiae bacterium DG1235]